MMMAAPKIMSKEAAIQNPGEQLQLLLVGKRFIVKGEAETYAFLPGGELIVSNNDERCHWGPGASAQSIYIEIQKHRREYELIFDQVQCCQLTSLQEINTGKSILEQEFDSNHERRGHLCLSKRDKSILRVNVLIDAGGKLKQVTSALALGVNAFVDAFRRGLSAAQKDMTRIRLRVLCEDFFSTVWWCTPIKDAPRASATSLISLSSRSKKRALFDALGTFLKGLDAMEPRLVVLITDGSADETCNNTYNREKISRTIQSRLRAGWSFLVLSLFCPDGKGKCTHPGVSLGVPAECCATFASSPASIKGIFLLAAAAATRKANGKSPDFAPAERMSAMSGVGCLYSERVPHTNISTSDFNLKHVCFMLDSSRSIRSLLPATVNALNNCIDALKAQKFQSPIRLQLHTFADMVRPRWGEGRLLDDVPRIEAKNLYSEGNKTALLDALAITLATLPVNEPQFICILTNGRDNASHQYERDDISKLIKERLQHGWIFIYLCGANPLANHPGPALGIPVEACTTFRPTPTGIRAAFRLLTGALSRVLQVNPSPPNFSLEEQADACSSGGTSSGHIISSLGPTGNPTAPHGVATSADFASSSSPTSAIFETPLHAAATTASGKLRRQDFLDIPSSPYSP